MGLFCLARGDTKRDYIKAAIANLELFLQDSEHSKESPMYCSTQYPSEHLLEIARIYVDKADELYKKEVDENPMINPPRDPDPIVSLEVIHKHLNGDEVADCTMLLHFLHQHPSKEEVDELLGLLIIQGGSDLMMTAALRYTWQRAKELDNWFNLRDIMVKYFIRKGEDPESIMYGLTKKWIVDDQT